MKKLLLLLAILSLQCSKSQDSDNVSLKTNKMLTLINQQRQKGCNCGNTYYKAVPPLKWNTTLEKVAKAHSDDMRRRNTMTHYGKDAKDPGDRLSKAGYKWSTWAENVAMGQQNEEEVMKSWLKSPGHCANIMNPDVTEVGVARSDTYWTQLFATPSKP
ncbi:CAP domain-containing protein [Capnocytophaga sputigena]|uniref:CAP domain-containing protein n=1 Tax=Capnocytophaga sputigena TaxID=1019 RepID=UPI0028E4CD8E|nr:CAP domain-containing protein [Capnocytophaga sputigena]